MGEDEIEEARALAGLALDAAWDRARACVTHHAACDCREYAYRRALRRLADRCERAERQRERLREVVQALHDVACAPHAEVQERWGFRSFGDAWDRLPAMARAALAGEAEEGGDQPDEDLNDALAAMDASLRAHDEQFGVHAEHLAVHVDPDGLADWRDALATALHQRDALAEALRPFAAASVARVTAGPGPPHPLAPYQTTATVEDFLRARAALGEAGA